MICFGSSVARGTHATDPHDAHRYFYPRSRDGTMGEAKAAQVLCDVLAGLVYLHMHHICHRDLKPEVRVARRVLTYAGPQIFGRPTA